MPIESIEHQSIIQFHSFSNSLLLKRPEGPNAQKTSIYSLSHSMYDPIQDTKKQKKKSKKNIKTSRVKDSILHHRRKKFVAERRAHSEFLLVEELKKTPISYDQSKM